MTYVEISARLRETDVFPAPNDTRDANMENTRKFPRRSTTSWARQDLFGGVPDIKPRTLAFIYVHLVAY